MLLGAHVFPDDPNTAFTPDEFAEALLARGYRAGYFPFQDCPYTIHDKEALRAFEKAFTSRDMVIAEVGAWCNPFGPGEELAKKNTEFVIERLAMADEVGAKCCTHTMGSVTEDSVHPDNVGKDFYALAVDYVRTVVDRVKPKRTRMSFEILPFNFLDSIETYAKFVKDIDRPDYVAVHLDPVNLIVSPRLYYSNAQVFRDAIRTLAPLGIVSMHLKDLVMHPNLPNTYLEEVPLGTGGMDIRAMFKAIDEYLPKDVPVMLEHLKTNAEYDAAAAVARAIAKEENIPLS